VLCNGCGANPAFNAVANNLMGPPADCVNNTITVSATDSLGNNASTTASVLFSQAAPTLTNCPSSIVLACAGPSGTPVTYSAQGLSSCPGLVNVIFSPPSGTLFPVGITTVSGYAVDG